MFGKCPQCQIEFASYSKEYSTHPPPENGCVVITICNECGELLVSGNDDGVIYTKKLTHEELHRPEWADQIENIRRIQEETWHRLGQWG